MDTYSPGPFGEVERKLPVMGQAIAGAIQKLTSDENPYVYFLCVFDPTTGALCWTSDGERESFRAALAEFLQKQAH